MTEIHETELPGIGVRHEFDTAGGTRIGVLTTRSGRRELLLYDDDDVDACRAVVHLDPEDSVVLAELLGSSHVSDPSGTLTELEGFAIDWLTVPRGSPVHGVTIGAAGIRRATGANIVAVVRGSTTNATPGPEDELRVGDVLVTCGTPDAVAAVDELLHGTA